MNDGAPEILILLSGGIDSTACLHFYRAMDRHVACLFVNYGQQAAELEEHAAHAVSRHYEVPLMIRGLQGRAEKSTGEIPARNAFLVSTALMERAVSVRGIALGLHAGTPYPDCSPKFVSAAQEIAALQSVHTEVLTPFLLWGKADVLAYCTREHVPLYLTYSCEAGESPPCGRCNSCLDRRHIDACA